MNQNGNTHELTFMGFLVSIAGIVLCVVACKNNNIPMAIFGAALLIGA